MLGVSIGGVPFLLHLFSKQVPLQRAASFTFAPTRQRQVVRLPITQSMGRYLGRTPCFALWRLWLLSRLRILLQTARLVAEILTLPKKLFLRSRRLIESLTIGFRTMSLPPQTTTTLRRVSPPCRMMIPSISGVCACTRKLSPPERTRSETVLTKRLSSNTFKGSRLQASFDASS